MENFVMLPRSIKEDLIDGKLTFNEYSVLVWIWISTNPYNGRCEVSYMELVEIFGVRNISYESIRKIMAALKTKEYVYFENHRGKGGKFTVFAIGFKRTNGSIQNLTVKQDDILPDAEEVQDSYDNQQDSLPFPNLADKWNKIIPNSESDNEY